MALNRGDWVQTEAGALGRVVNVDGETISVEISSPPEVEPVKDFPADQLKKIDGPN
jgi:preprotein translocase subunit YajC